MFTLYAYYCTHETICHSQRDDVAQALALLVDRPDAAGLALDIVGGDTQIEEALDAAISKRETAWIG